jgi:folate-binding protein YgfZ
MSAEANPDGAWSRLDALGVLCVAGADASAFLQGQVSNDLARLEPDRALLCALSTPQGRVVAVMRLVERAEGIVAILPAALLPPVIQRLKKYILRAKVTLTDESARWGVAGLLERDQTSTHAGAHAHVLAVGDEISVHALPNARHLLLGPHQALARLATRLGPPLPDSDRWRLAAIESGEPQVYPATSDLFVAQMLNLDLVDGVSFSKGCYTGQEIIARTQHRGRIKRRMLRYRLRDWAGLEPGDSVQIDGHAGRVVEVAARNATEDELLAVMTLEGSSRSDAPDLPAVRLPLPYSIPDVDA